MLILKTVIYESKFLSFQDFASLVLDSLELTTSKHDF
jgi:hypothetical protein